MTSEALVATAADVADVEEDIGTASQPPPVSVEHSGARLIELLLRDPSAFNEALDRSSDLTHFVRAALLTTAAGGLAFGAAVGAYRGGVQILYGAIKFSFVIMVTTVLVAPAISALNASLQRESDFRRDVAALLAALARGSLVLGALAPFVLAAVIQGTPYLPMVVVMAGCGLLAGAVGYQLLWGREYRKSEEGLRWVLSGLLVVGLLVSSQLGWVMRPFVGPPGEAHATFLRPVETGFVDQVFGVMTESFGYESELIPLGGRE